MGDQPRGVETRLLRPLSNDMTVAQSIRQLGLHYIATGHTIFWLTLSHMKAAMTACF